MKRRVNVTVFKPTEWTLQQLLEWNKTHRELRNLQFNPNTLHRHATVRQKVTSISHHLIRIFEASEQHAWSHKKQLEQLHEWILDTPYYSSLPGWAKHELNGVLWLLRLQQDRKQVWTHVLNGVRYVSGDKALEGHYNEITESESAHCWVTEKGFVRFN